MYRVLSVAEKPSVSKTLARILSKGGYQTMNGYSPYNKIFEFPYELDGDRVMMAVTSVSGHLTALDFPGNFGSWEKVDPLDLLDRSKVPVVEKVSDQNKNLERTLLKEARRAKRLLLWLDCDREGENISTEVKDVCIAANPRLRISRAQFSALTARDISYAITHLRGINQAMSDAVAARKEIDLRIGAAFTRFQSLHFRRFRGLGGKVISYGPCQFPTLGFVVERQKAIDAFVSSIFYTIHVIFSAENGYAKFTWKRNRLYDRWITVMYYEMVVEGGESLVKKVEKKEVKKWKPYPLTTVQLQKDCSRNFKFSGEETMNLAEELYQQGYISYPRTETDSYPETMNLKNLVKLQIDSPSWGDYARRLIDSDEYRSPRKGKHTDNAHPPIHPTKYGSPDTLGERKAKVYEYVVRSFLACCSADAVGSQTVVYIEMGGEEFNSRGLMVLERNFLDIFKYMKWTDKEMPKLEEGSSFVPQEVLFHEGQTDPPRRLSEADLLSLMDKAGIGTDATMAEHIQTIQKRDYAHKDASGLFYPSNLGLALVSAYEEINISIGRPYLRAKMEKDLVDISSGAVTREQVLEGVLTMMAGVYRRARDSRSILERVMGSFFEERRSTLHSRSYSKCGHCGGNFDLFKTEGEHPIFELKCSSCDLALELPSKVEYDSSCKNDVYCVICNCQTLSIRSARMNSPANFCPYCYRNLPRKEMAIESNYVSFMCSDCLADCPLAKGKLKLTVRKCRTCGNGMRMLKGRDGYFIGCKSFPGCRGIANIRSCITDYDILTNECDLCGNGVRKVRMRFLPGSVPPNVLNPTIGCFGGCDRLLNDVLEIKDSVGSAPTRTSSQSSSGLSSGSSRSAVASNPSSQRSTPRTRKKTPKLKSPENHTCGNEPRLLSVKKEGINKGRKFYSCSSCNFFQWADEETSSRPRSGPKKATVRKCSICRMPGHTKMKCPTRPPS